MTANDLHEATFIWPRTDAQSVVLTGSFDNWSKSIRLTKSSKGFSGSIKIPWNEKISYKYIVDGNWSLDDSKPKRIELGGYVNNVYVAPPRPPSPQETTVHKAPSETSAVHLNGTLNDAKTKHAGNGSVAKIPQIPEELQPKLNSHLEMSEPLQDVSAVQGADKAGDLSAKGARPGLGKTAEISQVDNPKEDEKPLKPVLGQVEEPVETAKPAPPTDLTSPKVEQEVSQVVSSNGSPSSDILEEQKRSHIMSFVPVNVPSEAPVADGSLQNGSNGAIGEETSTHKPLVPVSKIPQSPTTTSEAVAAAGPAEQSPARQMVDETPVQTESATTEVDSSQGVAPAPATQLPQPAPEAAQPNASTAEERASDIPSAASPVAAPVKEAEGPADAKKVPEPLPVAPAAVPTDSKPLAKSPSAPPSPTKPRFARFSRSSSASEPPQNGTVRKRKSTLLEKIKHVFSNEKKVKAKSKK